MNEREKEKQRYQSYRDCAHTIACGVNAVIDVRVDPNTAEVRMTDDGALVEATIWIPPRYMPTIAYCILAISWLTVFGRIDS